MLKSEIRSSLSTVQCFSWQLLHTNSLLQAEFEGQAVLFRSWGHTVNLGQSQRCGMGLLTVLVGSLSGHAFFQLQKCSPPGVACIPVLMWPSFVARWCEDSSSFSIRTAEQQ